MTLAQSILALIQAAPTEIAAIANLYQAVKTAIGSDSQIVIDAAIAALDARTDADVARLDVDAAALAS